MKKLLQTGVFRPLAPNWVPRMTTLFCILLGSMHWASGQMLQAQLAPLQTGQKVSIQAEEKTLRGIMSDIESQTGYIFVYSNNQVQIDKKISIVATNQDLHTLLKRVFMPLNINYNVYNNQIVLHAEKSPDNLEKIKPKAGIDHATGNSTNFHVDLFKRMSTMHLPSAMLDKTITGKVTDASDGSSLPGVNVLAKGTNQGTITDVNGFYRLTITDDVETLVFSSVGYQTQEVPVNSGTTINISLAVDIQSLGEIVVVGYGTKKKSHLTGAVAKVSGDDLDQIPNANADQALIGKLPGVFIKTTSANSGQQSQIQVRGISSINASNSPLIVVDGYPIPGDLQSINMNDVESIEVLKDAASASIYGSRAGSGVILITTKKGTQGKMNLEYAAYGGIKTPLRDGYKYPSATDWRKHINAVAPGVATPELDLAESFGTHTDWYDQVFGTGSIMSHQLSANGGNENIKYFFSGNFTRDEGIIRTNEYRRYSFKANVDVKANEWLDFGINLSPTYSERRDPAVETHQLLRQAPWVPILHTEQTAALTGKNAGDFAHENEFDKARNPDYTGLKLRVQSDLNAIRLLEDEYLTENRIEGFSNTYLRIKFSENLSFKTSFGGYIRQFEDERFKASTTSRSGVSATVGHFRTNKVMDWLNENVLNYNNNFGRHDLGAVAGFSNQVTQNVLSGVDANNFELDAIRTLNAGTISGGLGSFKSESRLRSFFTRIDYAFKDKYLLSLSSRWDGSSRFGPENKWGFFPAVSAGWRISDESFMENLSVVSDLKLRASFGVTGNNNAGGDFPFLGAIEAQNAILGDNVASGFAPTSIGNPALGWERTVEINAGLDMGLLENKLQVSLDVYKTNTDDLLLRVPIPSVTGFNDVFRNQGEVQNTGFELDVTSYNFTGRFKWTTSFNVSHFKNELIDFAGTERLITTPEPKRPSFYLNEVGSPLVQFYGYVIDQEVPFSAHNITWPINATTLDVFVKDLDGDGVITEDDRTVLGDPYPDVTWGITNNLAWNNFDLTFVFQGSHGAEIYNIDSYYLESQYIITRPSLNLPETDLARLKQRSETDANVQDASFVSLRSLNLGYTFPVALTKKWGLSGLRLYATANNLLFFDSDDYTGFNPEAVNKPFLAPFDSSPLIDGYQRGSHPIQRSFALGLNVKF